MIPKGGIKDKENYTAQYNNERIVSTEVHLKRLRKSYKLKGEQGIKEYVENFSKLQFGKLSWYDKFLRWLNKSK